MQYIKNDINKNKIFKNMLLENKVDGILIYNPVNRLWFSDFKSTEGFILKTKEKTILYVDGRYITAAKKYSKNVDEIIEFGDCFKLINEELKKQNIKKLGFESDFINYKTYKLYKNILKTEIIPIDFSEIRVIKNNKEIAIIEKACEITDKAFENVIKNIKVGMSELKINTFIFETFMENGVEEFAFPSIVASGKRGAMPHGIATNKKIGNNELITIDFGCSYKGYSSDCTRTIAIGDDINPKLIDIYNIVLTAQKKGIKAIKPGIKTNEIDKICRDYISLKGYGKYFIHSTGHGIGINVHEFPRISPYCSIKLKPGMIITVEPGIYIEGLGGVRIEDDILVTDNGYKRLTKTKTDKLIKL